MAPLVACVFVSFASVRFIFSFIIFSTLFLNRYQQSTHSRAVKRT